MATFDELLVDCVRANPHLYNKQDPDFMNAQKRKTTWAVIAESVQNNAEYCEKRWKNLRDQFSREHRRRNSYIPSGSGTAVVPKNEWDFYHYLAFLAEHIRHKPSQSSYIAPTSSASETHHPTDSSFRQPIHPSTTPHKPAVGRIPSPSTSSSPVPSATSDVTTDMEDYDIDNFEVMFATDSQSPSTQSSSTPSTSDCSKKRKTLLASPPDNIRYRKKSSDVDEMVSKASATFAAAVTTFSSVLEKRKAVEGKVDDETDAIITCLKSRLKNVPEESRTQCLIEMLQVIAKFEKSP